MHSTVRSAAFSAGQYSGRPSSYKRALPQPSRPSLVLVPSPNLIMEPLPVRHMRYAIGGAARRQRLLAVACASLYCADLVMASEIHGNETRYPTVTYADTDVSHTDVSRQVLRNLRISPPFRPGSGAWLPHWQPPPPAGSKRAPALPRGDDPQRTAFATDGRSSSTLSKLRWIFTMATPWPYSVLSFT